MGEKHRDEARNRQSKLTTVACWLVLAAILLGILRFTSLGARTTPRLDVSASREVAIRLWRPPGSPAHRLVAVGLGAADELFLLDTGAAETVISPAAAERAGLVESARPVLAALNDSFGLHALVLVDRLTLGARAYADFEALILDLSHLEGVLGAELAGVLGMNVLGQSPFEIDFVRDVLRIGGSLAALRADLPPEMLESEFPLLKLDGTVVAELAIEDQTALFVIDTGAVPTTVQPDRGFRGALYGRQMTRFDAGGARSVHVQSVVLDSLSLGHIERRSFAVDLGEFNLLGADFLQGMALFIDPGEARGVLRSLRSATREFYESSADTSPPGRHR